MIESNPTKIKCSSPSSYQVNRKRKNSEGVKESAKRSNYEREGSVKERKKIIKQELKREEKEKTIMSETLILASDNSCGQCKTKVVVLL